MKCVRTECGCNANSTWLSELACNFTSVNRLNCTLLNGLFTILICYTFYMVKTKPTTTTTMDSNICTFEARKTVFSSDGTRQLWNSHPCERSQRETFHRQHFKSNCFWHLKNELSEKCNTLFYDSGWESKHATQFPLRIPSIESKQWNPTTLYGMHVQFNNDILWCCGFNQYNI